ncbi:MAG: lysophospholipase [Gallionellales bacterium RBG_16_57_15]|nr:MAG: lysophospholipase [Gallionellales bacterium RBG_16_57_15]
MWRTLRILLTAYIGFALVLYFFQSHLVFYPEAGREIIAAPSHVGLPYKDVRLTTDDGLSLHGWFIPAAEARGTVLFLHGNAGNISHRIDTLQMFHRLGYSTLIFDYRGYGNSGGTPSEQGTYRDAEAAWRYLTEQRRIPSCRIVLFGESLGGAVASWLAARQKPAALVIASGFTSVPDLAQHFYPYLPVRWLAHLRYDTRKNLRAVAVPVLIAHSPEDEIIPFEHGQALYAAANSPKRFLELGGGHNDGFIFMRESWVRELKDFLGVHVNATCPR